ncbi:MULTISPECIES: HAD family hydrolase [unclassified Sphingobacterium]|uniref:HAD family hydrolase n=1 Tax=unclassified Sphingobacterium TaxID=2609468 RepID=UPI0020C30C84|nr:MULTISPECIES: HAD family hydrolase [unclassified Sphingobacterium]
MQKRVNFVVTDLDDTIWDWLNMWHNSFSPYLNRISAEFNLDITELKNDFKQLHQKYGTTEASFIIDDLKQLNELHLKKIYEETNAGKSIIHEYYSNKKNNLLLFEDTLKTLSSIKSSGAMIIGFTESHSFYTKYRLKTLNIDGLIDCIYAPVDAELPDSVKKYYPEGYWEPQRTEFRYLSREVKKPNSEILEIILKDFNAKKENTIYIGDKLARDIFMAKEAGITSVYAHYGDKTDGAEYDLLREVTHWSNEDVEREIKFKADFKGKTIIPDVVLDKTIKELMDSFEFYSFDRRDKHDNIKSTVEVWKKVVDVQQHFNDLELRIRNYALTLFTAIVAGIGLLEKEKIQLSLIGLDIPASTLLGFAGILTLVAFWYMDRYWYHKLLLGAVKQGQYIETMHAGVLPELGLTTAIGKSSPQKISCGKKILLTIHSSSKYWIFYGLLFTPLIILTVALFFGHQLRPKESISKKNHIPSIIEKKRDSTSSLIVKESITK